MADNALKRRNALMDASQGVSRGFWADGIGGPVDMMTTLANLGIAGGGYAGHKLGLLSQPPSLIENPVGGSEWIAQKMRQGGLLNDNPGSTADAYGRVAGGLLAPLTAARAPQIANALQQAPAALQRGAYAVGERAAGMAENQLVKQGGILPATVWHGSPHKFDKFDASKIGTGEGAQAYGHGLYLAENPAVAQEYKRVLSDRYTADIARGKNEILRAKQYAAKYQSMLEDPSIPRGRMRDGSPTPDEWVNKRLSEELDNVTQHENWLANKEAGGALYKVDLPDEQIAKMLDYDRPLADQAPAVQEALNRAGLYDGAARNVSGNVLDDLTAYISKRDGRNTTKLKKDQAAAAEALRQAGIPGIRYLDAGSRTSGQGSSNFVVFPGNEGLLSILERNGQGLR